MGAHILARGNPGKVFSRMLWSPISVAQNKWLKHGLCDIYIYTYNYVCLNQPVTGGRHPMWTDISILIYGMGHGWFSKQARRPVIPTPGMEWTMVHYPLTMEYHQPQRLSIYRIGESKSNLVGVPSFTVIITYIIACIYIYIYIYVNKK